MAIKFRVTFEEKKDKDMRGSLGIEGFRDDEDRFSKMGREIIQNVFDQKVKDNNDPAEVNFRFVSHENVSEDAKQYLDTIYDDLKEKWNPSPLKEFLSTKPKDYSYIVISDYNTSGMTGGWELKDYENIVDLLQGYIEGTLKKNDQKILDSENFLSFKRGSGQSMKGGDKLGSRGVGKWAYLYASQLMTLLFVSKRKTDNKTILSGVTRLESNYKNPITEKMCLNLGDWGIYDKSWGEAGKVPVVREKDDESKKFIDSFMNAFGIDRSSTGTDFIIPFVDPEYCNIDSILMDPKESNIKDFYRAISQNRLKISFEGFSDSTSGESTFTFDKNTLEEYLDKNDPKFREFVSFDKEHLENIESKKFIDLKDITTNDKTINKSDFHEGDFISFQEKIRNGETVTLRVPVRIIYVDSQKGSIESHYYISIKSKNGPGTKSDKMIYRDILKIREGINYRHVPNTITERYYCLIEGLRIDEPIYELIRKAEDGAHDKLQEANPNLKGVYEKKSSRNIIMSVKNSYPALCKLLKNEEIKSEDTDLAKDFFSITEDEPSTTTEGTGGGTGGGSGGSGPYGKKIPDLITCSPGVKSFTWNPSSDIDDNELRNYYEKGIRWDITFFPVSVKDKISSFLLTKINLNNTDQFDFTFKNLREIRREGNRITVEAKDHNFYLKLKYDLPDGFRFIKTKWIQTRNK